MAGETVITVVGNLVDDPELRFTPSGAAVANFRIASTPRTFDRQTNEWKDGEALFLSCSVWRQAAENVAESLQRGMRVDRPGPAQGRARYETREGEKRTVFEIDVDEVGPEPEVRHRQGHQDHAASRRRRRRRRPAARRRRRPVGHPGRRPAGRRPGGSPSRRPRGGQQGGQQGAAGSRATSDPWAAAAGGSRRAPVLTGTTSHHPTSPTPTIPA